MQNIFSEIVRLIDAGRRCVVVTIIRQSGSAPRQPGTRCLILENGDIVGTIGGGKLEFDVITKAGEVFRSGTSALLQLRLAGDDVAQSEMICGGSVDVYLEPVVPGQSPATRLYGEIAANLHSQQTGVLLTRVDAGKPVEDPSGRLFIKADGTFCGDADAWATLPGLPRRFLELKTPHLFDADFTQPVVYAEPIQPDDLLYIFGAGHISTCLAPMAQTAGFTVRVVDDRSEFANRQRFPDIEGVLVMPFEEAFDRIRITPATYIVIVTRGHAFDRQLLRAALHSPAGYIGMIGSRKKRDLIYDSLIKEGVARERLEGVHAPIGLPIGAQTPAQIAVSIAAELIQVRSNLKKIC